MERRKFLVVGAGFSGAVLARQLVAALDCEIQVWDERSHIAGNCHTERDAGTGVMIHRYGPHIFNTNEERVWNYVNRFGTFRPFINRVKASIAQGVFSMPINLHTINQFFGLRLNPSEARAFIADKGDKTIATPRNFEEQALKFLGRELYEAFFYGYTRKQWGCEPRELPAEILKRLPIRFNYDDNYYDKTYQGIPEDGYTEVIRRILDHPSIEVCLNRKFSLGELPPGSFSHIFYTGPIDAFFAYSLGRLSYRTVTFEPVETGASDFQGNAVINYPGIDVPWTRIHEHKHFAPWEKHERTSAFREYSKETAPGDVPYYPKRLAEDVDRLRQYRKLGENLPKEQPDAPRVSFLGRLATYRYMDMERVISEALDFSDDYLSAVEQALAFRVFPNAEA